MIDPESPNNTNHLTTGREQFESVKAILRERQAWLQGELQPLSRELYSLVEIITIECEIQTIDELFGLWEVNPF